MNLSKGGTISGATTVAASVASVERDRTVFNLPGNTVKTPRVLIFSRALPGPEDNAVLRTNAKLVFGDRNADGTARSGNCIIDITIRTPQDQPVSLTQDALDHAVAVIRDSSIMTNNLASGTLPYA